MDGQGLIEHTVTLNSTHWAVINYHRVSEWVHS